jgi:hypothetical protein
MNTKVYPYTGAPIDPRHVLGVSPEANRYQIEQAFIRLAKCAPQGAARYQCVMRLQAARDALLGTGCERAENLPPPCVGRDPTT